MSSRLAIGAAAALALAAHLSRRLTGSASTDHQEAELARLLALVEKYDGVDFFGRDALMVQRELERGGFEFVGAGSSRIVVGLGPHLVAKIDYDADSSANRAEAEMWRDHKEAMADYLVPVVGTRLNDRVLLMERATPPVTSEDRREISAACEQIPLWRELGNEAQWDFNWGRHGGRFKLLDYVVS